VLAEGISGAEQQFAELMDETARRIGLRASHFRNATGWPDPEQRMTARDLAVLARRIIVDHPEYYRFYNERSFRWNDIAQENRNPTLARVPGADGLKTGHTEEAGFGLTASAIRGSRRLILVVNGLPSMHARAEESSCAMTRRSPRRWRRARRSASSIFPARACRRCRCASSRGPMSAVWA